MLQLVRRHIDALAIALVLAIMAVAILVALGSQTSTILSSVGSPIGDMGAGAPVAVDPPAPVPTSRPGSGDEAAPAGAPVATLLIVRTGTLELEVADLSPAIAAADAAVTRAGGYVSASTRAAAADERSAEATYRIPSAAWDSTLAALRAVARAVKTEEIKTEEVTGQVVDLAARISNLRATEASLKAIMAKATKVRDVLDVQEQLTTTRGDIERLVAEQDHLADRAAFGSLAVTFDLPVRPAPAVTPAPTKGWDPGTDVAAATGKLVRIGQRTTSAGIWLAIVGLPLVIGGMILIVVGWQGVRLARWVVARRSEAASRPA